MPGNGILVSNCKDALHQYALEGELISISRNYLGFIDLIDKFEQKKFNVRSGVMEILGIDLMDNPLHIRNFMVKD